VSEARQYSQASPLPPDCRDPFYHHGYSVLEVAPLPNIHPMSFGENFGRSRRPKTGPLGLKGVSLCASLGRVA